MSDSNYNLQELVNIILKDHSLEDDQIVTIKNLYGPVQLTLDEFDKIIATIRLKMVRLKIVKKPILLKEAISKLGSLRDILVITEIVDDSLFARLGKMEGI